MQTGRRGQVREIADPPIAETHAQMLRLPTATGRLLRRRVAGAASRMGATQTGTALINHRRDRMRLVTRTHRLTTIAEAAAPINRRHGLAGKATRMRRLTTIAEAAAPINRQRARARQTTRTRRPITIVEAAAPINRQRALILRLPTRRLRALTPLLATVMGAAEARVTLAEEVEAAALTAAEVAVRRTEAVLTDAKIFSKKPARNWGGLFCV
jgi:hypothetical protein